MYKDASSTSSFHDMVRNMSKLTKSAKPTPFHHMLATLSQQDRLLRLYSQNVDGIDTALEPLKTSTPLEKDKGTGKWPKTVQLHGGLDKMVCSKCHDVGEFNADLFDGPVPPVCPECEYVNKLRTEEMGKRSHGVGMLRPRMVLYNEHNPDDVAIGSVTRDDLRKRPDAIIVVGTTLKVPGVKRIVREMCATVRDRKDGVAIWINNDPEPSGKEFDDCWDIIVRGKCDDVARMAALGQWDHQHENREVSQKSAERVSKTDIKIEIGRNTTFKQPPANHTPCSSPERPSNNEITPMSSRRSSVILDSFDSDVPAETPSRRKSKASINLAKSATAGSRAASQKNLTEMLINAKTSNTNQTAEPAKKSSIKFVKRNAKSTAAAKATTAKKPAAAARKTAAQKPASKKAKQAPITEQFGVSKSTVTTAAGKATKGKTVQNMYTNLRAILPQDSRVNLLPYDVVSSGELKSTVSDSEEERMRKSLVA